MELTEEPELTPKQEIVLQKVKIVRFFFAYGGSRSGKTWIIVMIIVFRSLKFRKSRHIMVRQIFAHAEASIWHETLLPMLENMLEPHQYKLNRSKYFVTFANGAEIFVAGLDDPRKTEKILGREFNSIYACEVSENPEYSIIEKLMTRLARNIPGCVNKGYFDCNPPPITHWCHRLFFDKIHPITNKPLKKPENYDKLLMNPVDNKANLQEEYFEILAELSPSNRDRFEFGKFVSADDIKQIIGTSELEACAVPVEHDQELSDEYCLGVDVGRYGPDPTVLIVLKNGNEHYKRAYDKTSITDVVDKTAEVIVRFNIPHRKVAVDVVGLGAGVVDGLEKLKILVIAINGGEKPIDTTEERFFKFFNLRAQMHWSCKRSIEKKEVGDINDPIIISDLTAPHYEIVGDRKIKVESKKDIIKRIGKSPDHGDAFIMADWARKASIYYAPQVFI